MKKQQATRTAIYRRLSRDDEQSGESMSTENQRILLERYARENGFEVVDIYTDDGWSGTNFDRPDFQRMKRDIELGKIDIVLVKDLSRLGRNQIETSLCIQVFFPEHNVRFVAVSETLIPPRAKMISWNCAICLTNGLSAIRAERSRAAIVNEP
ncbi:recombinase family protein [Cohnella sp. LGH]|uniref:recombinase family protein n=1 Tax=Cohnella sp. LGH TaxID=1619153 RepID=UPI001ADBAC74|nr:recombinase family protein [Cohnella sp. LGH]QTH40268.1 recombinase family protein [Cohnella sp. LGH]